ncbi:MAG: acyl carrier protein [bacterium]|nr:acyl carrier protein [bacterium]
MTLFEEIREIISEQLGIELEIIKPDASFIDDLGITLTDAIELVLEVGEIFGIEIPDEDAEKMNRVSDLVTYIENKIQNKI